MKCGENSQVDLEKKLFKDYIILYMYIAQGQEHQGTKITIRGQNFDCN